MTRGMPGILPLVLAVVITVLLGGLSSVTQGSESIVLPVLGVLFLAVLLTPYLVPLVWAWVLLKGQPPHWVLIGAAVWLATGLALLPTDVTWILTTHVVTGLVAGFGLMLRWKPGYILLLMAVVSLPVVLWTLQQMPMDEIFEAQKEQFLQARSELLMEGIKPGDEPPTLVQDEQIFDDLLKQVHQLIPGSVAVGLLAQAALTFGLVWILVRVMGLASALRGFPPYVRWRFPFAVVWILAVGVGLMIVPLPFWPAAGLNLVIVVCTVIAVQGAALQWHLSAGTPLLLRLFLKFMAGVLFLPLVLLGLADQWMDFRKLDSVEPSGSGQIGQDTGGNDDDSASDADDENS